MTFHTNWSSTSGGNIGFYTRATARLNIDGGTGNIGMGVTPDASYKVKLGGSMMINATNPGIQLYDNITGNAGIF